MYPVDLFEHIWVVDRLQRLGISRYFEPEIKECIDYVNRYQYTILFCTFKQVEEFVDCDGLSYPLSRSMHFYFYFWFLVLVFYFLYCGLVEYNNICFYFLRYWTAEGICWARNSPVQDIDDTAMAFRLLRLHGYVVSAG